MEEPLRISESVKPARRKRKRRHRRRCKRHPQEGPHSPTCRGKQTTTTNATNGPALVRILPQLKPVLDFLDVKGDVFTRAQIMGHLTEYIKKKALYDPVDPRKVYCENDQLGDIFGCKEFSTANACELLLENLENVSPTNSETSSSKRIRSNFPLTPSTSLSTTDTCSCSESDQPCSSQSLRPPGIKRSYETAFPGTSTALASVSSTSCFEAKDNSVVLTEYLKYYKGICENATDVVTDTSDDLFFLNETDEERVVRQVVDSDVSYTLETDEENNVRQIYNVEETFAVEYEPISFSDEERLVAVSRNEGDATADTEEDEGEDGGDELGNSDSSDSEIEEDDKWQCEVCSERNHPITRRCRRCWSVRYDWFPPTLDRTSSDPGRIRNETAVAEPATVSDSAQSTSHTATTRVVPGDSSASESSFVSIKCILCRKAPPNGCIVHGGTGHQVCCVACARKLKESNRPCPVCRKKIAKVIKNFM